MTLNYDTLRLLGYILIAAGAVCAGLFALVSVKYGTLRSAKANREYLAEDEDAGEAQEESAATPSLSVPEGAADSDIMSAAERKRNEVQRRLAQSMSPGQIADAFAKAKPSNAKAYETDEDGNEISNAPAQTGVIAPAPPKEKTGGDAEERAPTQLPAYNPAEAVEAEAAPTQEPKEVGGAATGVLIEGPGPTAAGVPPKERQQGGTAADAPAASGPGQARQPKPAHQPKPPKDRGSRGAKAGAPQHGKDEKGGNGANGAKTGMPPQDKNDKASNGAQTGVLPQKREGREPGGAPTGVLPQPYAEKEPDGAQTGVLPQKKEGREPGGAATGVLPQAGNNDAPGNKGKGRQASEGQRPKDDGEASGKSADATGVLTGGNPAARPSRKPTPVGKGNEDTIKVDLLFGGRSGSGQQRGGRA